MVFMGSLESRVLLCGGGGDGGFRGGHHGDFGGGEGHIGIFLPASPNATVQADLTKLQTDEKTLHTDIKALSSAGKTTLRTDEKAIRAAINALGSQLTSLKTTLETDESTWRATIRADRKAVRQDQKNGTDPTADQAKLKSDRASGLTAITTDQNAIKAIVDADSSVQAARQQLATDLPTISADEAAIKADIAQLVTDVQAQLNS